MVHRHQQKDSVAPKATTLLLALGIHVAGLTAIATVAPGDFDASFGVGGGVAAAKPASRSEFSTALIMDLAIQPEGKIVAGGGLSFFPPSGPASGSFKGLHPKANSCITLLG